MHRNLKANQGNPTQGLADHVDPRRECLHAFQHSNQVEIAAMDARPIHGNGMRKRVQRREARSSGADDVRQADSLSSEISAVNGRNFKRLNPNGSRHQLRCEIRRLR